MGAGAEFVEECAREEKHRLQVHSGRGGVLRAEDRCKAGGRDWTLVATIDRAIRLHAAATVWTRVRGRRRAATSTIDGASRTVWFGRTLLRRADRTLRGCVPC